MAILIALSPTTIPMPLPPSMTAVVGVSRTMVQRVTGSCNRILIRLWYILRWAMPCDLTPQRSAASRISATMRASSGGTPILTSASIMKSVSLPTGT